MKCSASPAGCLLASLLIAGFLSPAHSSAIPMWEFLTRGEKMSHLFNMFVKQVADHCDHSNMPDCQKVLLVYGLTNLAKMEDDSLDKMDPYQRGANDIIWESMMHGSYKKKAPSTEHRDYYAEAIEPSTEEGNWIGSEEETAGSSRVESYTGDRHVLGPMVVRVRPDGSPVPQDQASPLPRDEDKEEYQMMRAKPVPSVEQLQKHGHRYSSIAEILASDEGEVKASTYKPSSHFSSIVELFATRRPYTVNTAKPSVGQDTAPGTFRPYFPPAEESITARPVNIGQGLGTSRPSQVLSSHVTSSVTVSRSPSQH